MLNRVVIQNFKSIGEPGVDLELKPLTLLVGPNGGGKSSILEAIGVAAQGTPSGQSAMVPTWEDLPHKANDSQATITVYFRASENIDIELGYRFGVVTHPTVTLLRSYIRSGEELRASSKLADVAGKFVREVLGLNTYLLYSVRGDVPYQVSAGGSRDPGWIGSRGEHLLILLARIFGRREYDQIARIIAKWASRFGVDGLKAGLWGGGTVGADYLDIDLKSTLRLALSSSGARQILTVITQLFWARPSSLIMIEEPEISLHPKAQVDVLQMFAEAIGEGKQIIATTHGLFFIQGLGYAVQKKWLAPDQIAVYHVEKKKKTGTLAKRLPVNERGYIKGWIPSFAKVERDLMREWAKGFPGD